MAILSTADLISTSDKVAFGQAKALGTVASGYGIGTSAFGARKEIDDAVVVLDAAALDPSIDIGPGLRDFQAKVTTANLYGKAGKGFLAGMNRHAQNFGGANFSTLDTWLTWLNTVGTKWEAPMDLFFRDWFISANGGTAPKPENIYFECLQGAFNQANHLYTNGLGKLAVAGATFTPAVLEGLLVAGLDVAARIDPTKYAGADNVLNVSGFAGSSDTVTVTGYGFDPATKALTVAGKTWTATVAGNGDVALVVGTAPADSRIIEVTGIAAGASITAGTIYVESDRGGRPLIK